MALKGEIESADEGDPPGKPRFLQWDLGFRRQDPELFGDRWKKIEDRLLDLLASGKSVKVSAEGKSYTLPPVDAKDWKAGFKSKC